ncbi:MAG: hypothetical protein HYV09_13290 [Deltaproteobacteria bacterium]|nr:hypothetical protein [Deltaproteobacteria bacterium]
MARDDRFASSDLGLWIVVVWALIAAFAGTQAAERSGEAGRADVAAR